MAAAVVTGALAGFLIGAQVLWGGSLMGIVGLPVWVRWPSIRTAVIAVAVFVIASASSGAIASPQPLGGAVIAVVNAVLVAAGLAVCAGIVAGLRQQASFRRPGWELARAVEERERARVDEAVTAERAAMAGEIHDRLGHRLTLIAVQLGQLDLNDALPPVTREAVQRIRSEAADAAAELGETVSLLKAGHSAELTPV